MKEVWRDDRHYIVCLNVEEAQEDRHHREAIVGALQKALTHGDKALAGNKGFRRFLTTRGPWFAIDEDKIAEDVRYDGKWVLQTNTDLAPAVVALTYKHLWMVEAIFRSMKSLLESRPIYHQTDAAIRGHVFCSFLALVLQQELERRLETHGWTLEWPDIIRDLDQTGRNDDHRPRPGLRDAQRDEGDTRESLPSRRRRDPTRAPPGLSGPRLRAAEPKA